MPIMNIIQAVNSALRVEMEHDDSIVILGEDVAQFGGVFRATQGLLEEFGPSRVFDTPLSENGIVGSAIGMAMYGMRPIPEIQFVDFIYPAFDQIVNEAAKMRYRSGGQFTCPMVIRTPCGGGIKGGHYHSQSPESYFIHTAGLKVVMPSNPYDAKGLLIASIRDENPVIFLEPKKIYRAARGDVPEGEYTIELGKATKIREGKDVTIVTYGAAVHDVLEAADEAIDEDQIESTIIDLRTLSPYDIHSILDSVMTTGRVIIVHEAPKTCGFGAEISATLNEKALLYLKAPILRVTGFDTPFPYIFEQEYLPNTTRIRKALRDVMDF
ncbi:MAG: alpha-ketoacid dehydrogenase subunit beta [Acidobacteriota bacterium]|nr:alpha-ketoacid dehydrogenase subunit beta [Acidobacteriota bacterium]